METLWPDNAEADISPSHVVQTELFIEKSNEGANSARRVVVLGLSKKQGAAPLEIPQVDIVSKAGTDNFDPRIHGENDFRFGIVSA